MTDTGSAASTAQLPEDHPSLPDQQRTGVLILNLGTPDNTDYWSMRRYLSEFLSDTRVIDYSRALWQPLLQTVILTKRPSASGAAYRKIWNQEQDESPLKTVTRDQCDKLQERFADQNIVFEWGMRYGNPSTQAGIDRLLERGCRRILFFALYPQYSAPTTATAYDKAFKSLRHPKWQPAVRTATGWHDDPGYINVLANSVRETLQQCETPPEHLLASFHGMPKRYLLEGDPYHCFCQKTSRLLCEALNWDRQAWTTCFQSQFGPEEWLKPYTQDKVVELARQGYRHIAIISPAFISDCVETLEEIDIGLRETFFNEGGERLTYIPCLNAREDHIDFLAGRIRHELSGWL